MKNFYAFLGQSLRAASVCLFVICCFGISETVSLADELPGGGVAIGCGDGNTSTCLSHIPCTAFQKSPANPPCDTNCGCGDWADPGPPPALHPPSHLVINNSIVKYVKAVL